MRGWGIMLLIIGIGSFILPLMNVQFILVSIFGDFAPIAGIAFALIGLVLLVLSFRQTEP